MVVGDVDDALKSHLALDFDPVPSVAVAAQAPV
jgi:hypothetical protein